MFLMRVGRFHFFDTMSIRGKVFHAPVVFVLFLRIDQFHRFGSEPYRRALFEPLVVDRFDLLHSKVGVNFLGAVCVVVDVKHPASDPFPDLNYPIFPEIVAEKEI